MVKEKNITNEVKQNIISKISQLLGSQFNGPKSQIKQGYDRLNFACPYCGDSADNHYKKRGNLYWKTLMYHCYNCSKHTNVVALLKDFEVGLTNKVEVKSVLQFISQNQVVHQSTEYLQIGVFKTLENLSIDRNEFIQKMKLKEIEPNTVGHKFIRSRFLLNKLKHFAWSDSKNQLFIFNLTKSDRIIGYQVRNFDPSKAKYVSFTIEKMYDELGMKFDVESPAKINTMSLYYNIMIVDLSNTFTVFEGPTDALLYPQNSIALSGINKNSDMFDEFTNVRYFFDNDKIGKQTMIDKLKNRKNVFMWKKFKKDHGITDRLKDFNDLIRYCYFNKSSAFKTLDKYFTSNPYDIRNI